MRTRRPSAGSNAIAAIGAAVSVYAPEIGAHQQWLVPNVFQVPEAPAWVSFDHTFGDRRFRPGSGPSSYYRWWFVGSDGLRRSVPALFLGKTRTVGEVELETPGTYRLEGEEASMPWTLLSIEGKQTWQPGTRQDFPQAAVVRSTVYFNKAASYVTLGAPSTMALAPTGDPLEIVFSVDPTALRAKTAFDVTVLASGEPVSQQAVLLYSEDGSAHDEAAVQCVTNGEGACELTTAAAGRYLLITERTGTESAVPGTDGYSHSVTITIEVQAAALP
ncbi:MAG: DUF4198 domain-containing protein [Pseudomonadota bacterium]